MFKRTGWGEAFPAVYTTDTHKVNTVKGVVNPLQEDDRITTKIKELVTAAYFDLGDAEFYGERAIVGIKAFGVRQAIEMVSTVKAIVAVARIAAPLIIFGGVITALWFISKI
jgi:predicted neutral ceramidase superfamily lipid hydrolase